MDHYRLLPAHWTQWSTTPGQEDGQGTSIFATRNYKDVPERRTSLRLFHLPVERPHRSWPLEQVLVSVLVVFIDSYNKVFDIFVTCTKDQGADYYRETYSFRPNPHIVFFTLKLQQPKNNYTKTKNAWNIFSSPDLNGHH